MANKSDLLTGGAEKSELDQSWNSIVQRRAQRRRVRRGVVLSTVFLLALGGLAWWRTFESPTQIASPSQPLRMLALATGEPMPPEWKSSSLMIVDFDDHSRMTLAPNSTVKNHGGAPTAVQFEITEGQATFDIQPNGPRRWTVNVDPLKVSVLGTRFFIRRTLDAVEVSVERGLVEVSHSNEVRKLKAGEKFVWRSPPHRLEEASAPVTSAPSKKNPNAMADPSRVRHPKVETAKESAEGDAMQEADALRLSGQFNAAIERLRKVIESDASRAGLATYTVGKLLADDLKQPASAAEWFERAVELHLPEGLDEEASARAVECFHQANMLLEKRRAAAAYRDHFPQGRHRSRVEQWAAD